MKKDFIKFENYFLDFKLFWKSAEATLSRGRPSGGILVGVKKSLNVICKFSIERDIPMLSLYGNNDTIILRIIPVQYNLIFSGWDRDMSLLECFLENSLTILDELVLIGDFNGRTSNRQEMDPIILENNSYVFHNRVSDDVECNSKGRKIIELFENFGFLIMNGRSIDDREGKFTFIGRGNSVIDYCAIRSNNISRFRGFCIDETAYSDHLPIVAKFEFNLDSQIQNNSLIPKILWKKSNLEKLQPTVRSNTLGKMFHQKRKLQM